MHWNLLFLWVLLVSMSRSLTQFPTAAPTPPSLAPTDSPTPAPTPQPTEKPTPSPTNKPTPAPTPSPTDIPTGAPTSLPTDAPTHKPSHAPTEQPTLAPTDAPSNSPTSAPTQQPTQSPTQSPTDSPTQVPTLAPTDAPTRSPTEAPTVSPTRAPTEAPTTAPTRAPTNLPLQNLTFPCDFNCSGHGTCNMQNGTCNCDPGFAGSGCQTTYVSLPMGQTLGPIAIIERAYAYFLVVIPDRFNLDPGTAVVISSTLLSDGTGGYHQVFLKYGSLPTSSDNDFVNNSILKTKTLGPPDLALMDEGNWFLGILATQGNVSVNLVWNQVVTCPNNCNGNGACNVNGICQCYQTYVNDDCSRVVRNVNVPDSFSGSSAFQQFNYYTFQIMFTLGNRLVIEASVPPSVKALTYPLFYLSQSPLSQPAVPPTRTSYQYSSQEVFDIVVPDPELLRGTWTIGVWGRVLFPYTINISVSQNCPQNCNRPLGQGHCGPAYQCICNYYYSSIAPYDCSQYYFELSRIIHTHSDAVAPHVWRYYSYNATRGTILWTIVPKANQFSPGLISIVANFGNAQHLPDMAIRKYSRNCTIPSVISCTLLFEVDLPGINNTPLTVVLGFQYIPNALGASMGYDITVGERTHCPNNCSGHGKCDLDNGVCGCDPNYVNRDCSVFSHEMRNGEKYSGQFSNNSYEWKYFAFNFTGNYIYAQLQWFNVDSFHPHGMYIKFDDFPTSISYTKMGSVNGKYVEILIESANVPQGRWHIGINNDFVIPTNAPPSFSLVVRWSFNCERKCSNHGICRHPMLPGAFSSFDARNFSSTVTSHDGDAMFGLTDYRRKTSFDSRARDSYGGVTGYCQCHFPYFGEICNQELEMLRESITATSAITYNEWNYYSTNVYGSNGLQIIVNVPSSAPLSVYAVKSIDGVLTLPTVYVYDYALVNVYPDKSSNIIMFISSPDSVGNWTIGVTAASHTFGVSTPPTYYITVSVGCALYPNCGECIVDPNCAWCANDTGASCIGGGMLGSPHYCSKSYEVVTCNSASTRDRTIWMGLFLGAVCGAVLMILIGLVFLFLIRRYKKMYKSKMVPGEVFSKTKRDNGDVKGYIHLDSFSEQSDAYRSFSGSALSSSSAYNSFNYNSRNRISGFNERGFWAQHDDSQSDD